MPDLLAWFRKPIRRLSCDHSNLLPLHIKPLGSVVEGATLGWSGKMTRQFATRWHCERCGVEFTRRGMVSSGDDDRRWHPECYDKTGWPIDPATGKRLEIAR